MEQSPYLRLYTGEHKDECSACLCEDPIKQDGREVEQCGACLTWYHRECWGAHVTFGENADDINGGDSESSKVGPSKHYLKQYNKRLEER
jgi:hypothetical protein